MLRNRNVLIRVTDEQYDQIKAASSKVGLSMASIAFAGLWESTQGMTSFTKLPIEALEGVMRPYNEKKRVEV